MYAANDALATRSILFSSNYAGLCGQGGDDVDSHTFHLYGSTLLLSPPSAEVKRIRVAGLVVEAETRHFVLCAAQSNLIPENAAGTLEYLHFRLTDMVARTAFVPPADQRLYVCFVSERQLGGRNWVLKTSVATNGANALKDKVRYENRFGIPSHGGTWSHIILDLCEDPDLR
jgi:hypothetical protein